MFTPQLTDSVGSHAMWSFLTTFEQRNSRNGSSHLRERSLAMPESLSEANIYVIIYYQIELLKSDN